MAQERKATALVGERSERKRGSWKDKHAEGPGPFDVLLDAAASVAETKIPAKKKKKVPKKAKGGGGCSVM